MAAVQQGMSQGALSEAIDPCHLPIHIDPALREIDIPAWEGLPFAQVRQQFAIDYQCWKQRPHQFQMCHPKSDNFFPVLNLYERAAQFWQRILPRHRGQTVLIVAHGGTNHALISTAIGLAPQYHHRLQQSNCGISILDFPPAQPPHLRSLNSTHHLSETLPKLKEGKQGVRLLLLPIDPEAHDEAIIQQLAEQMRSTPIDLCVSTRFPQAKWAIDQILAHHPSTLRFETLKTDFLQDWQQTIARRTADSTQLVTGLAVTHIAQIQRLIARAIGLADSQSIALEPGNLNILHYSSIHHPPVLQSLNFNSLAFVSLLQEALV